MYESLVPSKNTVKTYVENGYYHLYNRGVEQRRIFNDREDYNKFSSYLKTYLSPVEELLKENTFLRLNLQKNNMSEEIDLLAYCLMPNHFHLLVKQKSPNAITRLMRQILTGYSMYFNKRNQRVGPLFQGIYKASMVTTDDYLLHLSRYIHLNPTARGVSLSEFEWSSYLDYLGNHYTNWVKTEPILNYFNENKQESTKSYKDFVESYSETNLPTNLIIEEQG